jgi:hypothetical protein
MAGRGYRNKFPKSWLGKRVKVQWLDPAGYVQEELSKVKPCPCVTFGVLLQVRKEFIIVASSQYPDDNKDPTVDATAITKGCVTFINLT